ncbi:MAG: GrdB-related putative oxidoreductase [Longicatena sp.]|uniref:GrdB-related putative oxidoreductase n=1 Tax=Anaerorhabdus sp. TaxID=1872524 RepID=UPI002FCAD4E9
MKIIMIYDQIQAGAGTKDDKMIPLSVQRDAVGPAIMMEQFLKKIDGKILACLYCGNGTYLENKEEVTRKLVGMVNKLKPDVVMCGPAFNYADFADMSAHVCSEIMKHTDIPALAAMSQENETIIEEFKDSILIVKTPKKGGTGLNDALSNMCKVADALHQNIDTTELKKAVCFN